MKLFLLFSMLFCGNLTGTQQALKPAAKAESKKLTGTLPLLPSILLFDTF